MNKRESSRAIIFEGDNLITIFRRKIKEDGTKKEYYVIPGGGLEEGETLEENVMREIQEELSVDVKILGFLGTCETDTTTEHYFACKIVNGILTLGGEEKEKCSENNYYEIRKININNIENIDISGKEIIRKAYNGEYEEQE